jgi:Arc/MetJ-type ribon-helix-helix transcriptional regulator
MQTLTKQILVRISAELNELIDRTFSQHLKDTGEYLTKSDYIRRALDFILSLDKDDVLIIYAHLNEAAREARKDGNSIGAQGLQNKADKFKALWGSMTESEQ